MKELELEQFEARLVIVNRILHEKMLEVSDLYSEIKPLQDEKRKLYKMIKENKIVAG